MRFCSPKRLWLALLFLSVAAGGARGQWRIVAPGLVSGYGSMSFSNGVLWIFSDGQGLYKSMDSGFTWNAVNNSIIISGAACDVDFIDSMHGVLATPQATCITSDGGLTLKGIGFGSISACYGKDTATIGIAEVGTPFYAVSSDGGNSWISHATRQPLCVRRSLNNTLIFYSSNTSGGFLTLTSDVGNSWVSGTSGVDEDSWSFAPDSCNAGRIYLIHEDIVTQTDQFAKIYLTTDFGNSWQITFSKAEPYLCGSITEGKQSIYCPTVSNGILRSLDRGLTWISIGGPSCIYDTRLISAIDDNIIVAVDTEGNIWRTDNSGGDSILVSSFSSTLSASPSTLFVSDTISCNSLTRSLTFSRAGCSPPSVSSFSIIGSDSASFNASNLSYDSISVTITAIKSGSQHAQLVLNLDNGTNDTVSLAGYVNGNPVLTFSTANVQTDTLGATAQVPITLNGLERAENVTLVMHYDGSVDYLGSFSPTGVQLDVPGQQWAGRSELSITGATSGAVMGYAKFNVFNDSNEAAHATFDSVTVLTQTSACEYTMPAPDTSTITTLSGCAIPILSQLIHLGIDPVLSIVPNPASGNVWISSNSDLGAVTIEIYDMLGIQQSDITSQINENAPIELQLPERSGVYNIVIRSTSGTRTLRVVREN